MIGPAIDQLNATGGAIFTGPAVPDAVFRDAAQGQFDAVLGRVNDGGTPYLAKWLDREIRFARKDTNVCSAAGVNVPLALSLPNAGDLQNPSDPASAIYIGAKPVVTGAPRVIDGDVKY